MKRNNPSKIAENLLFYQTRAAIIVLFDFFRENEKS